MGGRSIPTPAISKSECETDWEWDYHVYRVHERRWDRLYDGTGRWALHEIVTKPKPEQKRRALEQADTLDGVDEADARRAVELNEKISEGVRYDTPSVFDDAYHAGLYLAVSRHMSEDNRDYYRGERLAGRALRPSLYHGVDYFDPDQQDRQTVQTRLRHLRRFIDRLRANPDLPPVSYSEADLVAIAQHYRWALSDNAPEVGTWLLDVTSSPLIALLFATYSDEKSAGDTGIVYRFDLGWLDNEFPAAAGFRPLVPAGIPRIVRQDATFLEMHPEFLNQFVSDRVRFEQRDGLVFEDPYLGITESRLFPTDDRLKDSLQHERLGPPLTMTDSEALDFEPVDTPPDADVSPPFDLFVDVDPTYDLLVERIYAEVWEDPSALDPDELDRLHYLGRFHAFVQRELPEDRATPRTSITRLRWAVEDFGEPGVQHDVQGALEDGYEQKLAPDYAVADLMADLEAGWSVPVKLAP